MNTELVWATPDTDKHLAYIARVSNPSNQENPSIENLFLYMMREGHTSPFDMCNACIEINTTRDIGRQILRHNSAKFQEFSQRYANVSALPEAPLRECRMQDPNNRQNSIEADDEDSLVEWWALQQEELLNHADRVYTDALNYGIAKEQARVVLPEGLTMSRMYMNATFRTWIFYLKVRLHPSTQKEHRLIAQEILTILRGVAPVTMNAFFPEGGCYMTDRELLQEALDAFDLHAKQYPHMVKGYTADAAEDIRAHLAQPEQKLTKSEVHRLAIQMDISPPQRQPLTDEQIGLLTTGAEWSHVETPLLAAFARAIEAAHNIKETK